MIYQCRDERRRAAVQAHPSLNGIDFLEVLTDQRTLHVHFLKSLTDFTLQLANLRIEGGERIRDVVVTDVKKLDSLDNQVLVVQVNKPGDFSTYTLRVVQNAEPLAPPLDPLLASVEFSFKVACPSDFDVKTASLHPTEILPQPDINYLAKDYASFRQLILDRLATLLPDWRERHPADLGITLVELLAYVGDYLSYQQDAVATEAYLGTARRRVSVRRHARLVDYSMHDGCNARAWVRVQVRHDIDSLPLKRNTGGHVTQLLTWIPALPTVIAADSPVYVEALTARPQVFELLHDITLFTAHNEMPFYSWGARECCLPKGATCATLRGSYPDLNVGDVLILAEVLGPQSGKLEDADPARRYAVRLIQIDKNSDPLGGQFADPPHPDPVPVTEIRWHPTDALPFPLCIAARNGTDYYADISVAWGNIVLADHGLTISAEPLEPATVAPRYRPRLSRGPLTQAVPYDPAKPPEAASATLRPPITAALPVVALQDSTEAEWQQALHTVRQAIKPQVALQDSTEAEWRPQRDLLSSGPDSKAFVVEVETDGAAYLRFGDDRCGARPAPATPFLATYRIGNGTAGNVGVDALGHLVSADPELVTETGNPPIIGVTNPLPACGGCEPESIEEVRQSAPYAFHTQERAVSPEDYAAIAQGCDPDMQRAAATVRWTGSWHTVFVTVDRLGGRDVDADYADQLCRSLERYRLAGYELKVDGPCYVALAIEMQVDVRPAYYAGDVKAALLQVFSNRVLPDGRCGVFHPDNFSFGQPVFLSPLYAAAQAVAGVATVTVSRFERQGIPEDRALLAGKLELGRLEIARLDNDPNFPERGVFTLIMRGGR
jgi:uncharacterized protein YcbK (DUF882 family)